MSDEDRKGSNFDIRRWDNFDCILAFFAIIAMIFAVIMILLGKA